MARQTDLLTLWRNIVQAGGRDAYVEAQLRERGYLVERRPTDGMSDRELNEYKKALKAEADEKRKLARDAWRAYHASHIVFLGDGIFWSDEATKDQWDTPNAEERAADHGLPPLDSPEQLAEALSLSISELRGFCFHREAARWVHYARFTIPKRDGSQRPIWAPLPRLKEAQRWVHLNIVERMPVHGAAHGFLAGRSTLSNAAVHANPKIVLKMDIKNFFPTVTWRRVKGAFRNAGYREQVSTLLALLCTEPPREEVQHEGKTYFVATGPRCLPQGAPTSPGLTNTLCVRMDQRITGYAEKSSWRYTRYADDLTFSLPHDHQGEVRLGRLIGMVQRIVADEGFTIHPEKTRVSRMGGSQRITGLVVNGDSTPRTPRELRRMLRAALHNRKNGKPRPEGETDTQLIGYAAYIYMTNPELGAKMLQELRAK